ncbi:FAD-dependent oxidoreductase [Pseudomonas graminis]|uniref:NAD(P)/FAD-dependent oxidoreductase n=1 Tax=Pseudomonas graminis TaxID=158627 RepID=UPI00234BE255|nr:FAD-dependent oxidoreductase [Pseudomonas graminis]MDC6378878.1 FAD-dependent oxidoreductase [Pseudomonas graminis]
MSGETIVVGGGLVGLATAYGLACKGVSVRLLDQGDIAWRAARGNFGLVWVQGKGYGMPAYARLTLRSAAAWPRLAQDLLVETGVDVQLRQPGGFTLCLNQEDLAEETRQLRWLKEALEGNYRFEQLSPAELRQRLPSVGPDVVGACFSPDDGHVNPLLLLRALTMAVQRRGVKIESGCEVHFIEHATAGYRLSGNGRSWNCERVVLTAGLGNRALADQVGISLQLEPNRGQILITERLAPFLDYPTNYVRQTGEGSVQLGYSNEATGLNDAVSANVMSKIAQQAVSCFPVLANVQLVRAWGALRVLTPDGFPIYQESTSFPGVFALTCHSGVTLAAVHAYEVAPWICGGAVPDELETFSDQRFKNVAHEVAGNVH